MYELSFSQIFDFVATSASLREAQEREFIKETFADNETAVFSVHNFCRVGLNNFKRKPGTWFGPFSAAKTIEVLLDEVHSEASGKYSYANKVSGKFGEVVKI